MNVYPPDLGPNACAQVRQWRLTLGGKSVFTPFRIASLLHHRQAGEGMQKPMQRMQAWEQAGDTFGLGMAGAFVGFVVGLWLCAFNGFTEPLVAGAVGGAGVSAVTLLLRRRSRRHLLCAALEPHEVTIASRHADQLTQDYFQIVKSLMDTKPMEAQEEAHIRQALHRLGETVESLPPLPPMDMMADLAGLQTKAETLAVRARSEEDAVIAASLERQADALARRAQTIQRTAVLVRRHQTLRDEVAVQVKAFQTSLAAAQIHGRLTSTDFSDLADSITQIAQETLALTDARAELESATSVLNSRENIQTLSSGT